MTYTPKLSFSEFIKLIPDQFTNARQKRYKDFQQKVGKVLQRYRDACLPSTNDKEARHKKWQVWFGQVKFDEHEELISKIDDATASEIMAGRSRAIYHLAAYYRFHSLLDDSKWAEEIDVFIFGARLSERGTEVFVRNAIDLSAWLKIEKSDAIFHYSHDYMEIFGRERKRRTLESFLSRENEFKWLQLSGEGGQGKSRLARELVEKAKANGWLAGFIGIPGLDRLAEHGSKWHPDQPTLIVLDYVLGAESSLKPVIQQLAEYRTEFSVPVRLLLLERQPWNQAGLQYGSYWTEHGEFISRPTNLTGHAEWFLKLCERYDGGDTNLEESKFLNDGLVHLTNLAAKDLVSIVRSEFRRNQYVSDLEDANIEQELQRIDSNGRPLFAHFFAKALIDGIYQQGFTEADLLTAILSRERKVRWSNSLISTDLTDYSEPPELGEDSVEMRLALVATIVDGLKFSRSINISEDGVPTAAVFKNAVALNGGPSGTQLGFVPGMKPDVLGEWFVLYSLYCGLIDSDKVIESAWKADAKKTAAFYVHLAQDFPLHRATLGILGTPPTEELGVDALRSVVGQLASSLVAAGTQEIPQLLYDELEAAAEDENVEAMHVFGNFLLLGRCQKEDKKLGYELTKRAAGAGGTGALHNLAVCYENGLGVEKNTELSLEMYRRAILSGSKISVLPYVNLLLSAEGCKTSRAEAFQILNTEVNLGNADAMFMLAACYALGRGTIADDTKAFEFCKMASNLGHLDARVNLGVRYEKGLGVKEDLTQAKHAYLSAAIGGHSRGMYMIADYYCEFERTDENFYKALGWFRKAANSGYVKAMNNCATMLIDLGKPEHVLIEAVDWLVRGASLGDDLAMANLGVCLINGTGVAQNSQMGAEWTLRSAKAGNTQAMLTMSYLYTEGIGVDANDEAAKKWQHRATLASQKKTV